MSEETKSRKGIGGPNTKEGKERIRLNALKTGLHANSIEGRQAVADVVGVEFESVLEEMRAYYQPTDPIEEVFVRRIARCSWKLMVIESVEDVKMRALQIMFAPGTLENLSVIERRTDVQLHRAIAALNAKRKLEEENAKNKLANPEPFVEFPLSEAGFLRERICANLTPDQKRRTQDQWSRTDHRVGIANAAAMESPPVTAASAGQQT